MYLWLIGGYGRMIAYVRIPNPLRRFIIYAIIGLSVWGIMWTIESTMTKHNQAHNAVLGGTQTGNDMYRFPPMENIETVKGSFDEDWDNMDNPGVMEAVSEEMSQRVRLLREQCGYEAREENPQPYQFFMDIPEIKLRWCKISKVGSTSWDSYLSQFAPLCKKEDVWIKYCVPEQWALQYPPKSDIEQWKQEGKRPDFNIDTLNFLIVRHPFQRIVSAYRSKFENNKFSGVKYFDLLGKDAMFKYRKVSGNLTEEDKLSLLHETEQFIKSGMTTPKDPNNPYQNPPWPTFSEFSSAVLLDGIYERHWWPISNLCLPCSINYTAIGHMSTLDRDSAYVMKTLKLRRQGWPSQTNASPGASTDEIWKEYFSLLSDELLEEYKSYYQSDCRLFSFDCNTSNIEKTRVDLQEYTRQFFPDVNFSASQHTIFGTCTPYSYVAGDISKHNFSSRPSAMFSFQRHGRSNFIGRKVFRKSLSDFFGRLKTYLKTNKPPSVDMDWFNSFKYKLVYNENLASEGYLQMIRKGERFMDAFPDLLEDPQRVKVTSAEKVRMIESALSFLYGAFKDSYYSSNSSIILGGEVYRVLGNVTQKCSGKKLGPVCTVYKQLFHEQKDRRPLKMFSINRNRLNNYFTECDNCRIEKNYAQNEGDEIPESFYNYPLFARMTNNVSNRLGMELKFQDMKVLHTLCTQELTIPRLVPGGKFCSLFRGNDLQVLGYYIDLLQYTSYMNPARKRAGCIVMREALQVLQNKEIGLYFTHRQAFFPLLEILGIVSIPLTGWSHDVNDRDFYGDLLPHGADITMLRMDIADSVIVQAFLNEKKIEILGCGNPCTLQKLEEMFPPNECSFHE